MLSTAATLQTHTVGGSIEEGTFPASEEQAIPPVPVLSTGASDGHLHRWSLRKAASSNRPATVGSQTRTHGHGSGWQAFGRLSHAAQDFYAHSNYVAIWIEQNPNKQPKEIDPLVAEIISSPHLHSGKVYYPLELLTFIPPLEKYITPLLPHDSHAWMNLDDGSKPNFEFAFWAAVKRTVWEFDEIIKIYRQDAKVIFENAKEQ